jgi:hypothetical protein
MCKALKEFIAAIMVHDGLRDDRTEARHAPAEPRRHATTMQGKIGAARSSDHHAPLAGT